jgi:hypothetical protein
MNKFPDHEGEAADAMLPASVTIRHLAYADAAIMLVESLMMKLIEREILTSAQVVGAVEDAISTKRQMVEEGEHPEVSAVALGLLRSMANSLAASDRATAHRRAVPRA